MLCEYSIKFLILYEKKEIYVFWEILLKVILNYIEFIEGLKSNYWF